MVDAPALRSVQDGKMAINPHCKCAAAGFCTRHQIEKSDRNYQLCRGEALDKHDCGFSWFVKWELGYFGATKQETPITVQDWDCDSEAVAPVVRQLSEPVATRSAAVSSACIHRGDELRNELCPTCRGGVKVKVFACGVFGECTIGKRMSQIACCSTCLAFDAAKMS